VTKNIRVHICLFVLFSNLLCAKELKQITLQPSWFEQFQFAGYYMAKEKGFYQEVGLKVKINPFKIKIQNNIAQQVTDGKIDFAVGKETLIQEKANNKTIVILYALFQSSPLVLLTTKESKINTFNDFFGKKIMASMGDTKQVSLKAMLNSKHVQLNHLNFLPHSHNINDLVNNKTDIMSAYISKTPYDLEKLGVTYNIFSPSDYGFDLYSDFLYTSEEFIAKNIHTAKAFRKASLRGWQYAFANMVETVDVVFDRYNQQKLTKEALLFEAAALKKLAYQGTDVIGNIDEHKLKKSFELYKVLGLEQGSIDFKKFIYDDKNPQTFLTSEEKSYLDQKKKITMCIDPSWLPYEGFDNNGQHIGLNTEFLTIFRKQLPIPLETIKTNSWTQSLVFAKQRKCDLLSLAAVTDERKKYLNFTSPYLVFPHVLVTQKNVPFVNNFTVLSAKRIGMPKGYAQQEFIRKTYPEIILVEVDTVKDGLEKVTKGKLYGFIGGLDAVRYFLQDQFLGQLKVSGKFDRTIELGIGVRNDDTLLLHIFEKLVKNLSPQTIKNITEKSTVIKYIEKFNYNLLWQLLFFVVLIISAFLYRQYVLNNLNKTLNEKVDQKTKALQELNESLERKIKERTQKIEHSKELLQNVAYKDNLTGIFNRHYLFEKSLAFFRSSFELNEPLSMLLIDIDLFKKVNDVYGHITGDNILKYFVTNIQKTLRADDLFARYGGEEFIILLPKVNIAESLIVAEKLRFYIEQHPYQCTAKSSPIAITISIGVSQFQEGDSLEMLIDRADSALYSAKERGRNQVRAFESE
jgi:polar amino acid transport system substrate-binding protein